MPENWTLLKPSKPGRYKTRHGLGASAKAKERITLVTVKKLGRGLQVIPDGYADKCPMSDIGETELEWLEVSEK